MGPLPPLAPLLAPHGAALSALSPTVSPSLPSKVGPWRIDLCAKRGAQAQGRSSNRVSKATQEKKSERSPSFLAFARSGPVGQRAPSFLFETRYFDDFRKGSSHRSMNRFQSETVDRRTDSSASRRAPSSRVASHLPFPRQGNRADPGTGPRHAFPVFCFGSPFNISTRRCLPPLHRQVVVFLSTMWSRPLASTPTRAAQAIEGVGGG